MQRHLAHQRKSYEQGQLDEADATAQPLALFLRWLADAEKSKNVTESNAMTLATVGSDGRPSTRVVLIKDADERGLVWPEAIAPFRVHLVQIGDVTEQAQALYNELNEKGIEVLWDDRDVRAGEKFADADLIGLPHRVVVSEKHVATQHYEYQPRTAMRADVLTRDELFARL